jgi:hypothetical protein
MRHNQNRRSRGRSRKGPNPLTRSYESNGPDVKVRGTAAHIAEKYTSLARDAQAAGDIVAVESYLQHAEHYNRIVMAAQAQFQQSQPQYREGPDEGYDDDRPMNGRDRFDYNGDGRGGDEIGEDRFDSGDEGDDRGFRPRPQRYDDRERPRGPRGDRFQYRDRHARPEQEERAAPSSEVRDAPPAEQPVQVAPAEAEDRSSQPRRRRVRPRGESGGEGAGDGSEVTPDGAAALAAFRD